MAGLDTCAFEERAAIMEFDGGLTRFEAETLAARAQGFKRWEALDAIRNGNSQRGGHQHSPMAGQSGPDAMPGMQPAQAEKDGPVLERHADAGRDSLELLALPAQRGGVL